MSGSCHCCVHSGRHVAGIQPGELLEVRRLVDQALDPRQDDVGREGHFGLGVVGDGLDPRHRAVAAGRIDRHRDHARVQAPQEPGDEFQAGRIQQQGPFARQPPRHQPGPDRPGLAVELLVGQIDLFEFAVHEVGESDVLGLSTGPMPDHLHQGGWAEKCSWQIIEMHHGKDPLKRVGCPAITMPARPTALLLSIRPDLRASANRSAGHSKLSPDPGFVIFYAFGNVYAIGPDEVKQVWTGLRIGVMDPSRSESCHSC